MNFRKNISFDQLCTSHNVVITSKITFIVTYQKKKDYIYSKQTSNRLDKNYDINIACHKIDIPTGNIINHKKEERIQTNGICTQGLTQVGIDIQMPYETK